MWYDTFLMVLEFKGDAMHKRASSAHHYREYFVEYGTDLTACDESSLY
jgi:hypothetical protein